MNEVKNRSPRYKTHSKYGVDGVTRTISQHCRYYNLKTDLVLEDLNAGRTFNQVFRKGILSGKTKESKYFIS
jgi:hypothetical protein